MAAVEITCVVDARAQTGEAALWDERIGGLYWVDIPRGLVHRFDPSTGCDVIVHEAHEDVGCLALRESGDLVIGTRSGWHFLDPASGRSSPIADPEADRPDNRFNDGAVDPCGRFWAGTMKDRGPPAPVGRFYMLEADLSCRPVPFEGGFFTTNGLAFALDGRTVYFSDSHRDVQTIWACAYDPHEGVVSDRRLFFDCREVAGRPDGAVIDADGCYWMAGVGGWQLVRLTPAGRVDRIVELPVERPSRPMFGGPGLETLFVTSIGTGLTPGSEARQPQAGGLFAIEGLGVKGVVQPRFAG